MFSRKRINRPTRVSLTKLSKVSVANNIQRSSVRGILTANKNSSLNVASNVPISSINTNVVQKQSHEPPSMATVQRLREMARKPFLFVRGRFSRLSYQSKMIVLTAMTDFYRYPFVHSFLYYANHHRLTESISIIPTRELYVRASSFGMGPFEFLNAHGYVEYEREGSVVMYVHSSGLRLWWQGGTAFTSDAEFQPPNRTSNVHVDVHDTPTTNLPPPMRGRTGILQGRGVLGVGPLVLPPIPPLIIP